MCSSHAYTAIKPIRRTLRYQCRPAVRSNYAKGKGKQKNFFIISKSAKISQFFNQITIKIKALKEYFNGAHTSDMSSLSVP